MKESSPAQDARKGFIEVSNAPTNAMKTTYPTHTTKLGSHHSTLAVGAPIPKLPIQSKRKQLNHGSKKPAQDHHRTREQDTGI